jgi:Ca-activated chloride channel family protein
VSEKLGLTLASSRRGIARHGGSVHLSVEATPPEQRPDAARRPVALALVLDRSGSMAEPALQLEATGAVGSDNETPCKLDYVRDAALRMLERMPDGDAVTLITFDDEVRVEKPLTVLSKSSRTAMAKAVHAIRTGGSTNLAGGLRAGVQQLEVGTGTYRSKVVLLSDGLANVGEVRPAVLGEVAAGAAHNAISISTLGVGLDYHLGLMSHVAECGNGEFHHVAHPDDLQGILAGEFLDAAAMTARNVDVTLRIPDQVAVGSNINRFPQVDIDGGVRVALGDLLRKREFLIELTTPIELACESLTVEAIAEGADASGKLLEARAVFELPVLSAEALAQAVVDESIVALATERLQAKADMDASLASEAGDTSTAKRLVAEARQSAMRLSVQYGTAVAARAEVGTTVDYLDALAGRLDAPETSETLKRRFAMASMSTRGRGTLVGPCPRCGEKAFFEADHGGRMVRSCNACGHEERS